MMTEEASDVVRSIRKKPGLQIWTINRMRMVPVPEKAYGNFFEGDCYVVSTASSSSCDIHYWIGCSSSQDEQGASAILVSQLDEALGGSPVQHREVQNHESPRFRSYFKNGLIYKKGGVGSGFQHVETNAYNILRLLHVKGTKHITASEVEVSWNSFNKGDIFLLDMGKAIVQWNGPQSNRRERLKAVLLAQDIRDRERGGRAQIGVVEGAREEDSPEMMKVMRAVLGQRSSVLREAIPDDMPGVGQMGTVRLYSVSDDRGQLMVQEVASQPLTQDLLRSTDCYIIDQGGMCVYVWKGKHASREERRTAMSRAVGFIKAKNYPSSTGVEVMAEGGESAMFKHLFKKWKEDGQTLGLGKAYTMNKIAKVDQVKFDVMELHARPEMAAQERMVDDASGKVQIWRIEHHELQELHPSSFGQFYGGDCYLVLYTYLRANRPQYILYMWLGRHATQDEITACAYHAVAVDNRYDGAPVQVRVTMGKEPRHFLAIFKGRLIIYEGGTGKAGVVSVSTTGARLFQVRGTDQYNTRAIEVPARAASLNTNDVFLLKTDHVVYLWYGKGCSGDEREMGKRVSELLTKQDNQVVMEGQEPTAFWVALGGKAPYANDKRFERQEPMHSPRLFECSNQTGRFVMTEVYNFAQQDLDQDDVMLLDTWQEIFLWIGGSANQYETEQAGNSALEYLRTHPAGRDLETPIISIKQGFEPLTFTGWFNAWDPHKWSGGLSYEEMKRKLGDTGSINQITLNMANTSLHRLDSTELKYGAPGGPIPIGVGGSPPPAYKVQGHGSPFYGMGISAPAAKNSGSWSPEYLLHKAPSELPVGVDSNRREDYLSEGDFERILGCTRGDFLRLPKWRQMDMKKKAGLY
ncbi:advillin [Engraulis encrasicolus]|uniref:advillin n=1 Tax=Engraulis encrasicolus TaxID=184585 RepID=UPI002FCF8A03